MIDTTQTTLLVTPKKHAGSAMRAKGINDANRAPAITEGYQVFAEHPQPHWRPIRLWEFLCQQHWMPEAAK